MKGFNGITLENYERFLIYALEHSDAFMFITFDEVYSHSNDLKVFLQDLKPFLIKKRKPAPEGTVNFLEKDDLANFFLKNNPTDKNIKKYHDIQNREMQKQAEKGIGWPGNIGQTGTKKTIYLFKSDLNVLHYLLKPKMLDNWHMPMFPEDLSFFRHNMCWLFTVIHEWELDIVPQNIDEYNTLKSIGIDFIYPWSYYKERESIVFNENY